MEVCNVCGENFTDTKKYRRNLCRKCFNAKSKQTQRNRASTLEGYFKFILTDIKNNKYRHHKENELSIDYLLELYEKQNGKCALSGIKMTWGFGEFEYTNHARSRNPYNTSIDRIDNNKGYTKDNVWLICSAINIFKGRYETDLIIDMCNKVAQYNLKCS